MKKKFHICILISGLVFDTPYGEEKFTNSFAEWLSRHGHDVTLIGRGGLSSTKFKHFSSDAIVNQIKNTHLENGTKALGPRYLSYALRPIISILFICRVLSINRKYPVDLIHAQDTGYAGFAAIVLSKLLKKPSILSSHGIRHKILESNVPSILKKCGFIKFEYNLDIFNIKNADKVIADSPHIKKYLELKTGREIDFFPNPINVRDFDYSESNRKSMKSELGINEKTKVIGYVGRLTEEKNLFTLLFSFVKMTEQTPFIKLVLVGDGPIRNQLERVVNENAIKDKVIFCGLRRDVEQIFSCFDIFVLPSYTEGWSTALLESMASGRAIVCSDIEANSEMVTPNKEALFANPYKQSEFSQAIQLLCDDDLLRSRLGSNAKIKANMYDTEIIFPMIVKFYENIGKPDK